MSDAKKIEIKVPQYGELRESVKDRLRRVREAFSEARTLKDKQVALDKLLNGRRRPAYLAINSDGRQPFSSWKAFEKCESELYPTSKAVSVTL